MNKKKLWLHCMSAMIHFQDRFDAVAPRQADWICERLAWHKILPLAAALSDPGKPKCPRLESIFMNLLLKNSIRAKHYERQVKHLFLMLRQASIDFVPYKGPFWNQTIYPDYSWRHIGDIDLMLGIDDARKASAMLQSAGWVPDIVGLSEEEDFRLRGELTLFPDPKTNNQFPVQLHWDPLPSPRFVKKKYMPADLFKTGAEQATWQGIDYLIPCPEIQFFYHLLHATCQHQFLRFAHLLTPIHFLIKFPNLDWDFFQELTHSGQTSTPVYYGLKFISHFYALPKQAQKILSDTKPQLKSRIAAALLHPNAIMNATQKCGRHRRELFRVAMSW